MSERRKGIGRRQVIAGFFALLGLLLIFNYAPQALAGDTVVTRIALAVPQPVIAFPSAWSLTIIGFVMLIAGSLGLTNRVQRWADVSLWTSAVLLFPAILIWAAAGKQTNATVMLSESLRLGTPLALGALAGIWAERSGVINIAIEGMMLMGAAFGFAIFILTGQLWWGVIGAVIVGGIIALLHGLLSISFRTDQIISGTVVNILAIGITGYLRRQYIVTEGGGRVTLPSLSAIIANAGFPDLARSLEAIPIAGTLLFGGKPIFFAMLLLVVLTQVVLFMTRWGLRTRAVGENPKAADTVGIAVNRMRYINLFISGCIAGLGGAWFSLETVGNFDDGMTAGKGFIALAAMIFGKWMPFGAFGGAMLFGFAEALGTRFQILQVQVFGGPVPVQFLQVIPYVVTMIVLAGLIGRAVGPAAVGKPYEK
ncbi:ABC transporter permease [Chloroflexus sp. MS-CIW-1]|jgi:simple sugar transport system permease protein|uniref:ABC transporter permease n=1 Tax=Chloroflexus sp. MS-CIW-1 TaxID=3055768 RepID=UPI001B202AE5|nr:ABC transporter permease [Chloroflexus sp. MS-CIW-1]MBO9347471.1 ABC transporter permease [Chloroflexus sp.]MDN5272888.1 ABC transporter permease [Chloroflexus sp. MS-CIW-1]